MLEDPYVEVALQAPPSPDYIHVLGPEYVDDEIVAEEQPYAEDASPNAQSPEYVPEFDLEAHPEDDDDEDPEEDPVDYPADGADDGDDEEGSSEDDKDDDMDIEADEEEEKEHPAPADSDVPEFDLEAHPEDDDDEDPEEDPVDYPADGADDGDDEEGSSEDDKDDDMDIEADEEEEKEHPAPADSVVVTSTAADQAPYAEETEPFETDESAATPCISEDRPEVTLPPRKRLGESSSAAAARPAGGLRADYGFVATMDRAIMRDPEREVSYGITDSWDEIVETLQGAPVSTDMELGGYMREFETRVRQDTEEIYMRLDDEPKARLSREAWVRSTDASDLVRGEIMSLRTTVLGQMTEIRELHAADHRRQIVISEMLRADHRRYTEIIELRTALQGH
nr:hypothetical protein [Tanacetum cinerariifolium]